MANRQIKEDLEKIYASMNIIEEKQSMTVGTTTIGDLDGPTKEQGPKGSGSESTDATKGVDADARLQGDTVEKSKKGKGATSKFDELYQQINSTVVSEEKMEGSIESSSFNDEIGDFPPAGPDEESAERDDGLGEASSSIKDLFNQLADVMAKIGDKLGEDEAEMDDGEIIDDEVGLGEGEALAGEAVESTPAPDSVAKLQSKSNMNVKGVKIVKTSVSSASSGQENGGKPKNQPDSNLGPTMKFKSNGSGAAVEGGNKSAFE